jgi:hypothetical protein
MRPSLLLLVAAASPLAGCPGSPIEASTDPMTEGATSTTTATTSPTDPGATQIMTTDNSMGTTVTPTSEATTTTGEPDPTTESGESTGGGASVIVEGLAHPESILHDTVDDVYLISNINGDPGAVDDDGFISRVLPDGTVEELKWIDGASDVTLDAPKGLTIFGDVLYVADLTFVRKFDRSTGAPLGEIEVPGAAFLNDLAVSPFGNVYVSDTMTDTLHVIGPDDSITTMLSTPDLTGPNGLVYTGEYLMVAGFNGNNLFQVPFEGSQALVNHTFEFGSLDGLVAVDGGMLVSTWEAGKAGVYMLSTDLTVTPVVEGIDSPADIEVDLGRNTLLVPVLLADRAEFYPL